MKSERVQRWFDFLFRKRSTANPFVIIPIVVALIGFSSGFTALVFVEHYRDFGVLSNLQSLQVETLLGGIRFEVLIFTLIGGFAGLGIAFAIHNPIKKIMEGTRQIASGNFDSTIDLDKLDEFALLGRDFNKMASALSRYFTGGVGSGWIILDLNGIVISNDKGAEKLLDVSSGELLAKNADWIMRSVSLNSQFKEAIELGIDAHLESGEIEITGKDKRGQLMDFSLSTVLLKDTEGKALAVAVIFKDIAKVSEIAERVQQADRLAALGSMAAGLAHEIRNPLSSIKGLAQLLGEKYEPEDSAQSYTRIMTHEIDRLDNVVSNLLNFSQLGPGKKKLCSLVDIVEQAAMLVQAEAGKSKVKIKKTFSPDLPSINGEDENLVQVFLNILLNAIQAAPLGSQVEIVGKLKPAESEKGAYVQIDIRNPGAPIDSKIRSKIFDPFFSTKKEGTGLGLAISHQIVSKHKGHLHVSRDGDFTVFTVEFPV
jgi:nitrogen-specific signal transduction histidine kinase/HAMP domain-containing protein